MTCVEVHLLLPGHVYGDLPADEARDVVGHLRTCPACRAEVAALTRTRSALDATPTPPVRVDVPALFAAVADRRVRHWRRLALAGAALAAGLLVVLGLRLHVTVGNGQVVIAWREASRERERPEVFVENKTPVAHAPGSPDLEDRVRLLQELTRALATDIESRDRQRGAEIDAVRARVDAVQQYTARQWADAERWVNALYVAQFKRPEEKANP